MTEIIGCARKMNLLNIELEVVADNKVSIAFYHKMGFSEVGVYKNYWFANDAYSIKEFSIMIPFAEQQKLCFNIYDQLPWQP